MAKRIGQNFGMRYSEAFKMAIVRELEEKDLPCEHVRRKYGIKGCFTVQAWVRKYGNGSRGIRIRVEKPEEINELKRLGRGCASWRAPWPTPTSTRPWSDPSWSW